MSAKSQINGHEIVYRNNQWVYASNNEPVNNGERPPKQLDGNLFQHAKRELELAGMFDKDSDYNGMMGDAVLELMEVFASQDHSGFSASMCLDIFNKVAKFENLTPIGTTKDEWVDVSEQSQESMWQNKRNSALFSKDNGKSYYHVDQPRVILHPTKLKNDQD